LSDVLNKYLKHQTPKTANRFRSDLGKEIADLKHKKVISGLSSTEKGELRNLSNAKKEITKSLTNALEKASPDLTKRYKALNTGYRKDVVPYEHSPTVGAYRANEMGNPAFLKSLANEETFMHRVGRRVHPELATRQLLPKIAKGLAIGGTVGSTAAGGAFGYNNYFGGQHD
jgi:hypothetical protein